MEINLLHVLLLKVKLYSENLRNFVEDLKSEKYTFIGNIWGAADLADMHLMSQFNKEICFCYMLLIFP